MAKVTRRETSDEDLRMLPAWAEQYEELKSQIKFLQDRQALLKKNLSDAVESYGYEDDRGSLFYDVTDTLSLKKEKRVTQTFDEETALDVLKEKYPELFDRCTYIVTAVDQDSLLAAHYEEAITEDDFNRCFPKRITFAFKVVKTEPTEGEDESDAPA